MSLFAGKPAPRRPAVAPWLRALLLQGRTPARGEAGFAEFARTVYFAGPDALRSTWATLGPELLAEWTAAKPGTRPWGWWAFDAPDARALSGRSIAYGRGAFGVPFVLEADPGARITVESEAVFLKHHALLEKGEAARLRAGHWKSASVTAPHDEATAYAADVTAGREVAGRAVRLACARHLADIRGVAGKGLTWRVDLAARAVSFFADLLTLDNGEPFALLPFQAFIVGSLFGWYGSDGCRRFRSAYIEASKGSGKTPVAAGIGLFGLVADGEPSPEVYSAATDRDQAKIAWRDAQRMVEASPELREVVEQRVAELNTADGGIFRAVSAEHRGLDGKRVHVGLTDELHEHRDALVLDKLRAGTKARRNALLVSITNAGFDRHSVCWRQHDYSLKVLEGAIPNESWFAYVCGLDLCERCRLAVKPAKDCPGCDSWTDEGTWRKANPALGAFLPMQYLRELVAEAQGMPARESIVRRLNFCEWLEGGVGRAIALDLWDRGAAPIDANALRGRECFGGLDLARVNDLSALTLVFPPQDEGELWKVLAWFWCPEDDITVRSKRDRIPLDLWARQGHIEATPGNVTDFGFIEQKVLEAAGLFQIRELGFDRTFAGEIVQSLMGEGVKMVEVGQGFLSMAAPTAELLRLVKGGMLQHGGNPVLRWMASNLAVATDAAGNLKPDKERSADKIDGMSALCTALARALVQPASPAQSIYDQRAERDEPVVRWV